MKVFIEVYIDNQSVFVIVYINELKFEIWPRPKGLKIFQTLLQTFVQGNNESFHDFHSFCMDESEQNEVKGLILYSKRSFFLPTIQIEEIFNEISMEFNDK